MKNNNTIAINLDKVTCAEFNYVCHSLGRTYKRKTKPTQPTVNGHEFDCKDVRPKVLTWNIGDKVFTKPVEGESETMLQYAKRRGLIDIWSAECILQLTANQSLIYTGNKAISIWKAWCSKVYKKK